MDDIAFKLSLVTFAGFAAQWVAWRAHIPAIVLFLVIGLILGPVTGYLHPVTDFGIAYKPAIGLAVALILFEGGMTLNFSEIRGTSTAIKRVILIGGPLVLVMGTLAGIYIGGLGWQTALVLGAILVVTGPTVIMPLLRQARLKSRPASLLRWEAIVNDPIGALFAVIAFELVAISHEHQSFADFYLQTILAFIVAIPGAFLLGRLIVMAFARGYVPEYLKSPGIVAIVLLSCVLTNMIVHDAGLLTVTVLGITLGNSRLASLNELRRFKETITVILVASVFILLTASLKSNMLDVLGWRTLGFVIAILFVVRPLAIFIATIASGLTWQEKLLTAWIAPRGIVAVAVAGVFATSLTNLGIADGQKMLAYTFAIVVATILLHGFSLPFLARILDLRSTDRPGILIIGGSQFSADLGAKLNELNIPVCVADPNWNHLRPVRDRNIPFFFGDVLTEDAHHQLELNGYDHLIAATDNDSLNALICTDFGPEMGRANVYQIGDRKGESANRNLHFTIGGKPLFMSGLDYWSLREMNRDGWTFKSTELTEKFTWPQFKQSHPDAQILLWLTRNNEINFAGGRHDINPAIGSVIVSFAPKKEIVSGRNPDQPSAIIPKEFA